MADTTVASRLYTALGRAAMSQSAFEQSNADRKRLDQECGHSHLVASLGESWDSDPGALCWLLRSLGISIFGLLFMSTSEMLGILGRARYIV